MIILLLFSHCICLTYSNLFTSLISFFFQIYYCEYYEKYLEEYERRRRTITATGGNGSTDNKEGNIGGSETTPNLEASILMDDIMNNGMTFCSIMQNLLWFFSYTLDILQRLSKKIRKKILQTTDTKNKQNKKKKKLRTLIRF